MSRKTIQLVSNYDPYIEPHVGSIDLILCQIPNPYEILSAATVRSLVEGSSLTRLQTWGPQENPSPKCQRAHLSQKKGVGISMHLKLSASGHSNLLLKVL